MVDALAAETQRLASGDPFSVQKHSYVARSRYLEQLDRYEALFPARQILIIKSEDLFANTNDVWCKIQRFLGLPQITVPMRLHKCWSGRANEVEISARSS